ncbi:uncharacterized protein UV8b_05232 [Ustilaginoidea virens]|uniref:HRQ family protein 2 n=1 Tax=Ustilaginoidea virens TaxID=1159556 RepID=A0A8E5MIQ7_USTVR|nr:uncharacterized protein UV8b_05232 [Ustilaginoidea virens]QUC20991.1 hypothetical protein UV8b_05232 [Ustilaginoidea virens]
MAALAGDGLWKLLESVPSRCILVCGLVVFLTAVYTQVVSREATAKRHAGTPQEKTSPAADAALEPLPDLDWKAVEPTKYMPVKPVYHITMGKTLLFLCVPNLVPWLASPLTASQALQQDAPSNLVTVDRDYLDRVTLRRRLIEQKGSTVHGCLARGREAVAEVYSYLLKDHLPVRYPTMFRLSADRSVFQNKVTGKSFPADPPADCAAGLRALGETIEEDLFLLHGTPDGHLCVAFVCCFPAGFDPSAKMGRLLMDIHAPVPSYGKIGSSVERFFAKLQVGKSVKRLNWTVQTDDELCKLGSHTHDDKAAGPDNNRSIDIEKTFVRVELQTLTRLPETRAILFSFKTYLYSLCEVKREGSGPELADAIEGLQSGNAPGMWSYKSAGRWARTVCEYLRS